MQIKFSFDYVKKPLSKNVLVISFFIKLYESILIIIKL